MAKTFLGMNTRITVKDGAGTPASLVVAGYMGDAALQGLRENLQQWVIIQVRGANYSRRQGARVDPKVGFSVVVDKDFADASSTELTHWVNQTGPYTGLTSTDTDADGLVFDMLIEFMDGGSVVDQYLLEDVVCLEYGFQPGDPCVHAFDIQVTGAVTPS